jgi:hypothetical protein
MDIARTFETFCDKIHLDSTENFDASIEEIVKKLNKKYYDSSSESDHLYMVGSIGRETAVDGVSDIDIIFNLPSDVFRRFDNYETNGQSALLQEVKNELLDRYPKTTIKGDGQVVSIQFTGYTIELVPGFRQADDTFKYPDSNNGGSWKITDPIPEQNASKDKAIETSDNFVRMCNMLRAWKNNVGFKFGGLLTDTLVFNYFERHPNYISADFSDYVDFFKDVLYFLSREDPEKKYWFALGSNQQVYNSGNGSFVRKAEKAWSKINNTESDDELENILIELFGHNFSSSVTQLAAYADTCAMSESTQMMRSFSTAPNENFIEDMFPVDIQDELDIDCKVTQDGFRPFFLSAIIKRPLRRWLSKNKSLTFSVESTSVIRPYDIYWKVRNCGEEAVRRNMERGSIFKGHETRTEHTDFNGEHYVECYIIKNGVCVARSKIVVPIDVGYLDIEHKEL